MYTGPDAWIDQQVAQIREILHQIQFRHNQEAFLWRKRLHDLERLRTRVPLSHTEADRLQKGREGE